MVESLPSDLTDAAPLPSSSFLELKGLGCERDGRVLFSDINWSFNHGDIVQVIGPNGSGKTTLLRCLVSLSEQYKGDIFFKGSAINQQLYGYRQQLLYLGHLPGIKSSLSPAENLRWYGGLHSDKPFNAEDIAMALSEVGLAGFENIPCHSLSAGQQRRVSLARLYLSSAKLWVLDEPLTAIDKEGIAKLSALFKSHAQAGGVVVLTTHQDLAIDNVLQIDLAQYQPPAEAMSWLI